MVQGTLHFNLAESERDYRREMKEGLFSPEIILWGFKKLPTMPGKLFMAYTLLGLSCAVAVIYIYLLLAVILI